MVLDLPIAIYYKAPLPSPDFNNPRVMFAHRGLTEEQMCKLEKWLALPYNIHPIPTDEEIEDSLCENFYFGFYIGFLEIRDFAIRYNEDRMPCTTTTTTDMFFMQEMLSR